METKISEETVKNTEEEEEEEDEEEEQSDEDEAQDDCGAAEMKDAEEGNDEDEEEGGDTEDGGEEDGEEVDGEEADGGDNIKAVSKVKGKAAGKKCLPGIIYLGHIPPRIRPKHVRNMLSVYGEIGRVFLQPEDRMVRARKKKSGLRRCDFTEGWVEFRDKRVAKRVAASLHNTPMATRKRQWIAADLWCIKYLHRFQWTHLSERLSYERSVLQQRLRTEISQAKRETNFYLDNVDKSAHMERKKRRVGPQAGGKSRDFTQRQTEDEIQAKKKNKESVGQKQQESSSQVQEQSQSKFSLLSKIFSSRPPQ